ncbi:hypothetical protein [Celeribacter sp.]|uniref:hypothetical protein n=1 Tax=Celeribacter sp. TaxID=1890673 RepID=UPI003A913B21
MANQAKLVATLMMVAGIGALGFVAYEMRHTPPLAKVTESITTTVTQWTDAGPSAAPKEEGLVAKALALVLGKPESEVAEAAVEMEVEDVEPTYTSSCEMRGEKKICSIVVE